jgi:DNA-binding FadR family transcriptional regulator
MTRTSKSSPSVVVKRRRPASAQSAGGQLGKRGRSDPPFERNIYSQLAGKLGQEIVAGVYPAGSLLPNAQEMGAQFSVSRTALREAYSILSAKGLIVARPKIGTRVRPQSEWNLLDPEVLAWHLAATPSELLVGELFALRRMVEPPAAALAAAAPSRQTVQRIAEAYSRMERFKNGEGDLIGADLEFHMSILEASGNRFLAALGGVIHTALECSFRLSWRGAAAIQENRLHQHRDVLEAIRDGSPERARERMAELLRDSIGDVQEYLRQRDEAAPVAAR